MPNPLLLSNASRYPDLCGIVLNLKTPLGHGQDGSVWKSNRPSAIKAFERRANFAREIACYLRLRENNVRSVLGHAVPTLLNSDEDLMVVEISLVTPPYLLDFGKAYLDSSPYTNEQMAEWDDQGQELFGERWADAKAVAWALKKYGIFYYDIKPANVKFENDDED